MSPYYKLTLHLVMYRSDQARGVYRLGISKCTRAVERLKTRYQEFQTREAAGNTMSNTNRPVNASNLDQVSAHNVIWDALSEKLHSIRKLSSKGAKLYRNPLRNFKVRGKAIEAKPPAKVTSRPFEDSDPYAYVKQGPSTSSGKNPEKYRFDMSLLFKDGKEYCIQEARAKHLGLLGKKWAPPPPTDFAKKSRTALLPPSVAEPTVTINTKEALKDVFGMYNSPEKTTTTLLRAGALGTKHAPVKEVEQVNAIQPRNLLRTFSTAANDENAQKQAKPLSE